MTRIAKIKRMFFSEGCGGRFGIGSMLWRATAAAMAFLFVLAIPTFMQGNSEQGSAPVNISGFWQLRYDSRNIPRASLTPAAAKLSSVEQAKNDMHVIRWCILVGVPAMMDSDAPIDIEQDSKAIGILSEVVSGPRTIYLDGRKHPDMDTFDNTTVGNSIGHWEGDTLVVDTVGFSDKGITTIPGGGIRTPDSHLVERYRLVDSGKRLLVTFTWTDPKVFTKPHTYAFLYDRAAPGYRPGDTDCDASDKLRADFLENPPHE
jgi:hypothetical protein